jgi:hypothetical protein
MTLNTRIDVHVEFQDTFLIKLGIFYTFMNEKLTLATRSMVFETIQSQHCATYICLGISASNAGILLQPMKIKYSNKNKANKLSLL